jgi:hypothetical protein
MKQFISKFIFFLLLLSMNTNAQIMQYINFGDIKNYSVDTNDSPDGTPGSTYEWSIWTTETTPTEITTGANLIVTNQTSSQNRILINWNTTPAGVYTVKVTETNNGCIGTMKEIAVNINEFTSPTLVFDNSSICSNEVVTFTINNAPANSQITFTILGGTSTIPTPITVDNNGQAIIPITANANEAQIILTLTSITLSNGNVISLNESSSVDIRTTITSDINFD